MDKWIKIDNRLYNLNSFSCLYVRKIKNPTHEGKNYDIVGMYKYKVGHIKIEDFHNEKDAKEMMYQMGQKLL